MVDPLIKIKKYMLYRKRGDETYPPNISPKFFFFNKVTEHSYSFTNECLENFVCRLFAFIALKRYPFFVPNVFETNCSKQ